MEDISAVLAMLGKLRGKQAEFRTASPGNFGTAGVQQTLMNTFEEEASPLEEYLKRYYEQQDREASMMQKQMKLQSNQARPNSVGFGFNPNEQKLPSREDEKRKREADPYKYVRDQAMKSAFDYLKIKNPHLISSLPKNSTRRF